jgi:hypothetical protein
MPEIVQLKTRIPAELTEEFSKRLCYISEDILHYEFLPGEPQSVKFELSTADASQAVRIAIDIQNTAEKLCQGYRIQKSRTVASAEGTGQFTGDPHPLLKNAGELFEFGDGRFGLGPQLCRVLNLMQRDFDHVATEMGATERQFPALLGADVMERCQYIRSFPSSLTLVQHLREDSSAIADFAATSSWNGHSLDCRHESLSAIQCLLSPNVCFHYYAWAAGSKLAEPTSITATGKCARYESKNMKGLERLWDFTMREVIFAGPRDFVLSQRDRGVELVRPLLEKWGLTYDISTATDPFFINDFAQKATFQLAFELKYELLTPLPFRGGKKIAAGSFNYHQDFFGKAFAIEHEGKPVHTGCIGFGLERLLLAFVAQHGTNPDNWPAFAS